MEQAGYTKYFESQQPDEEIVFLTRRHILALVPTIFGSLFIYLLGFLAIFVLPTFLPVITAGFAYNIFVLFISMVFLFNTVFFFSNWVLHYLHVALLTTEHFVEIDQYGLFGRRISELTLDKIQDVSHDQSGLMNTVFNLGFVRVQTAGEAPNFELYFVPDPANVCRTIMETEESYSSRHGIRGGGISGNANNVSDLTAETTPNPVNNLEEPKIEYPGEEWNQQQK